MSIESRLQRLETIVGQHDDEAEFQEECRLLRVGIEGSMQCGVEEIDGLPATLPAPPQVEPFDENWRVELAAYGRRLESSGFVPSY
jgi:hypothetical protein